MISQSQPIGIIGVGNMGGAMADRLLACGWSVALRDVSPEALARFEAHPGVKICASSAQVAQMCGVTLLVVVDGKQVRDVLFDEQNSWMDGAERGDVLIVCPTVAPQDVAQTAEILVQKGMICIDAPMSGGPVRARDGQMSLMLAGQSEILAKLAPLLQNLAAQRFVCGENPGQAATVKLLNNLLAAIHLAASAEVFAVAGQMDVDLRLLLEVVTASSGQSWIASDRIGRYLAGDTSPKAHMGLLAKDSGLAVTQLLGLGQTESAGALGVKNWQVSWAAMQKFQAAMNEGMQQADDSLLLAWQLRHNLRKK